MFVDEKMELKSGSLHNFEAQQNYCDAEAADNPQVISLLRIFVPANIASGTAMTF